MPGSARHSGAEIHHAYAPYGVKVEIPPVASPPDAAVVQNLLTLWSRLMKS